MLLKECARELGVTVALLREMLRTGLLAGEKQPGKGWCIAEGSVEALRQSLALLRSHSQPPLNCWSWLYETDSHSQLNPTEIGPWKAITPHNAGDWLGSPPTRCPACKTEMVRMLDASLGEAQHCAPCGIWDLESTSRHQVGPPD